MVACAGAASARAAAARERARNRMLGSSTLVDQAQRTPERLVELLDLVGLGRIGDAFEERGRRGLVARALQRVAITPQVGDRKSTRLNSSHHSISYAVFCLKKKK